MPETTAHPSQQQLSAYSLGQLPPHEAVAIESHISKCEPCCDTIIILSADDTFVGLLKEARQLPTAPTVDHGLVPGSSSDQGVPAPLTEHPRYEILSLIGKGGMGDVYKARHRKMERTVALKVINRGLVRKAEAIDRFHREVKAAAQLSHPNIVTAYDADQAGDFHFMVMEYVDGIDLSQTVKDRGALPVAEACDYIRQAAIGLQHAHERGMVHRDIKPHNLMVTADGTVKILDLGLASLAPKAVLDSDTIEARGDLTVAGAIMGTPDFISPEQADDARSADIRSDIYSLGSTLYFLLSGQPPFADGSVMHKLKSHATAEPDALSNLRADIPSELESIIARMTAKSPVERFQAPREVAAALERFVQDQEPETAASLTDALPPKRRSPFSRLTALAASFSALLIAAAVYFVVTNNGVVRIEVLDDSLNVAIDGRIVTLDEDGKRLLAFGVGEHEIVVRQGETELITDNFELRRHGDVRFRVSVEMGKVVVSRTGEEPRTAELPGAWERDALAEEWARLAGRWRGAVGAENGQVIEMPFELVVDAGKQTMTLGNVVPANGGRPSPSVGKSATATLQLDPTMAPKRLTATFPVDQRGKMFGVYRLNGAELTLCLAADGFPEARTIDEGFGEGNGSRFELVRVTSQNEIQLLFDIRDGKRVVEIGGQPVQNYQTYLNAMVAANPGIVVRMDIGSRVDPQLGSHLLDFAAVVEAATFPNREARTELSPAASAVLEGHQELANLLKKKQTSDVERLEGDWDVIASTHNGKRELAADKGVGMLVQIKGDMITKIQTSPNGEKSENVWGRIELNRQTNLKSIDIINPDGRLLGIYELKDGGLKICLAERSDIHVSEVQPLKRPTTFAAPAGSELVLLECQRKRSGMATDASAPRTILDQGYTILDSGKQIGSRRLVVTKSDQALSIADETSLALAFAGVPPGIVELDVSAVYSLAGDTPRIMRVTTSAKEQGSLLMHGTVEFSSEETLSKWTTYMDGGRKLDRPKKQQATLKQPPPGPLMLDSTIQVVGPLLLPKDGERKFVRVELNGEAREGEALVAYQAGWRLRRTTRPQEAGFTITIFAPDSDKPEMTWEYDSLGNCKSVQLTPTTVIKPQGTGDEE